MAYPCSVCGALTRNRRYRGPRQCDDCKYLYQHPMRGSVHRSTRFEDDPAAQRFVAEHPQGATPEEVAIALGVSRELVRRLVIRATDNFIKRAKKLGLLEEFEDGGLDRAEGFTVAPEERRIA